jgi:hypothetical protein
MGGQGISEVFIPLPPHSFACIQNRNQMSHRVMQNAAVPKQIRRKDARDDAHQWSAGALE